MNAQLMKIYSIQLFQKYFQLMMKEKFTIKLYKIIIHINNNLIKQIGNHLINIMKLFIQNYQKFLIHYLNCSKFQNQ